MNRFPETLIQIHYHVRTGGVSQVMRLYADAFRKIKRGKSILICSGNGAGKIPGVEQINIEEFDYQQFTDICRFLSMRALLKKKLLEILNGANLTFPAAVVAHNLNLGKNPALSAAFSEIAREWNGGDVRFFSVIHDFAEEGRLEQLKSLQFLEDSGIKIKPDLYSLSAPVNHVVPGNCGFEILSNTGFRVTLLHNPVRKEEISSEKVSRDIVLKRAAEAALQDDTEINLSKPIFCYPSRVIYRKNPLEAIALACLIFDSTLLLGTRGTGRADIDLFNEIRTIIRETRLPVILDAPSRIFYRCQGNPAALLYSVSDYALSTSLAEGFGYGLYEPWLYGKAVLGRLPARFKYQDGMDSSLLYTRLPLPSEWVDIESFRRKYIEEICAAGMQSDQRDFQEWAVQDGKIDFGILDWDNQVQFIRSITAESLKRSHWRENLEEKQDGWPGISRFLTVDRVIDRNRTSIEQGFSGNCFLERFRACFSQKCAVVPLSADYEGIKKSFYRGSYRFLLQRPGKNPV
ncbi:MAG: hypothetical protein GX556_09680 [Fibrobacter sp.]|nr:hypothetical protein [Fibrobacter sp.]